MSSVELNIVDSSGAKTGTKSVSAAIFGSEKIASQLIHQAVRYERNKKRSGTHTTKTRTQVAGGGAKPWRQKGTGRARAGSNTSPIWVGGGVAHGPKQRSYEFSMNKKERKKALRDSISIKQAEGKLIVIKDFSLAAVKTKAAKELLLKLGVADSAKSFVILSSDNETAAKSLRNLVGVKVGSVDAINAYDLINAEFLVVEESEIEGLEGRLS